MKQMMNINLANLSVVQRPLVAALLISFCYLLFVAPAAYAQQVYKWQDEDGQIHYANSVPPEMVREEHQRLNQQGVVVEHIEDADVPNLLLQSVMSQNQLATRVKKRLLLATYNSEADIETERDRAYLFLDKEADIVNRQLSSLRNNLSDAESMYKNVADDHGLAYSTLQATIASLRDSLERQHERQRTLHAQRLAVQQQYLAEVKSYRDAIRLHEERQLGIPQDKG